MSTDSKPVVILGGGLAGLTAATYLRRHGFPVRVLEAGPRLAGLSRSERDPEGFTYDCGAHFITNRLAAAVGISARCRPMPRYGESVWLRGRTCSYPFGLMRSPKYALSAMWSKMTSLFRGRPETAVQYYRARFGRALADEIAVPLTEAWSGAPAEELSASIGDKLSISLFRTIMLRIAGRLTKRTVAIGYSGTVKESPHVWHVYPEGGVGMVCEKLAEEVSDAIHLETPVEEIRVEEERIIGVQARGEFIPARAVISTAPLHILPKLIRGSDRLEHLSRFRYRAMVFVNVKLEGASGLPDVVTWVPERDMPFFRLTDIGAGLPWLVPEGKSQVTCDIGCQVRDETWNASDEELGERSVAGLERMVPGIRSRYLGCRVVRTPLAYPVYHTEYETDRRALEEDPPIQGLLSVGRNGEFAHILMEDVYWRTRRRIAKHFMAPNGPLSLSSS